MATPVFVAEVHDATRADSDRRIRPVVRWPGGAVRHGCVGPGLAVVATDCHSLAAQAVRALAVQLRQIDGAVRRDFQMAGNGSAGAGGSEDEDAGLERQPAV